MSEDRYLVNSVLRGTEILKPYTREKTAFTHSELAKKLGLNRSTVTRLLYSLEKGGFWREMKGQGSTVQRMGLSYQECLDRPDRSP